MKSLGSYTLGDQYVSPQRRLSAMLTQQGSKGGPSNSWQETMGRIAQQLAGAYIGYKDTQNQNKAFDAMTGLEPDSTSMKQTYTPDEVQKFASKLTGGVSDSLEPSQSDMNQAHLDSFIAPTLNETAGNVRPQVNTIQEESFGPQQAQAPQTRIDGSGWDRSGEMPDFSGVHQLNSRAGIPQADPRQEAVNLMQRNQTEQLNEKMNPRDYSMQQLRGLENNPYAKRILAQMMMQNADMDYERGLAQTARGYVDSDYERKREDDIEDRDKKLESDKTIANLKSSLPVKNIREYQQAVQLGLFEGSYEDYLQTKSVKMLNPLQKEQLKKTQMENESTSKGKINALESLRRTIRTGKQLAEHPGREWATGGTSWTSIIPGTDSKGFAANLDTFKSQNFLPAVAQMKGAGALSDAEGKKLTDAIGALDPDMPQEEFKKSLDQIVADLEAAEKRMPGYKGEEKGIGDSNAGNAGGKSGGGVDYVFIDGKLVPEKRGR